MTTGAAPAVTVIVTTYNRPELLRLAVESIQEQTFPDFEVIIVDDCSTDETGDVAVGLAAGDDRIRLVRTEANSGCNVARNLGVTEARGRYVAFLDDDDLALPNRLELSHSILDENESADFVHCGYGFIDIDGRRLGGGKKPTRRGFSPGPVDPGLLVESLYCDWAWLPTCTLTFRADIFDRYRYPPVRRSDGDSTFHCQLAASGSRCYVVETEGALIRRDRRHSNMSDDRHALLEARRETLEFLRGWLRAEGITKFDGLHRRAWSNQLVREARMAGGLEGLTKVIAAAVRDPRNQDARAYIRSLVAPFS